jgi:DNA-binding transcriptional regulator/RsmH inhibitor MraZ
MAITGKFNGTHISSITQNRVVLPKQFKDILNTYQSDKIVVSQSPNYDCLVLFPKVEFESICDVYRSQGDDINDWNLSILEDNSMGIQSLEGSAGRFRISPELIDRANITDKVKFVGRGNYVALWSLENFDAHQKYLMDQIRNSKERPVVRI